MTTTIDKAGRIVIPKGMRDSLGLLEGSHLRLTINGGVLQITPEAKPVEIQVIDGFPVILSTSRRSPGSTVDAIKKTRRARDERQVDR